MKNGIKIVTIGGGSSYTPELVEGFIKRHKDSYYSVYREELSYSQIAELKDFIASDKAENVSGIVLMKNTNVVIRISHWQARSLDLYQTVQSGLEGSSSIITVLYQA